MLSHLYSIVAGSAEAINYSQIFLFEPFLLTSESILALLFQSSFEQITLFAINTKMQCLKKENICFQLVMKKDAEVRAQTNQGEQREFWISS